MSETATPSANHIVVLTTAGNEDDGLRLARELVGRRLAGCVNLVGPCRSVYRWKGEIQEEQEWQLVIKTTREQFDRLGQALRELSRYELPEILALPIERGDETYLNWLTASSSDLPGELP